MEIHHSKVSTHPLLFQKNKKKRKKNLDFPWVEFEINQVGPKKEKKNRDSVAGEFRGDNE
jgi:hypothetical protein